MKDYKPTVVFDFDGVIHSYRSGWKGPGVTPDPVVPGIAEVIEELREGGYLVVVVSTRCADPEGRAAVESYLTVNGIIVDGVMAEKPPALCYVDDRAILFTGNTEGLANRIKEFRTWVEDPFYYPLPEDIAGENKSNQEPVEKLRPCKGTYWYRSERHDVVGRFHGWGSDYEDFCEEGPGNFSVGIIECDDGTVAMCRADTIVFLDRENGERR